MRVSGPTTRNMTTAAPEIAADPASTSPDAADSSAGPSLAQRAAGGFLWTFANGVLIKLASLAAGVFLARVLLEEDFGLAAMALSVSLFISILREAGVLQVLIHRQRRFHLWANPVFWLSMTLGLVTAVLIVAAAPAAAWWFGEPQVRPLLYVLAAAAVLHAAVTVPSAKLQIDLRFASLAISGVTLSLAATAASVVMAYRGWGAYSLIVPTSATAAVRLVWFWSLVRVPLRLDPQIRRWRYVGRDWLYLFASLCVATLVAQGDYLILGRLHDKATVGVYYFAFVLSLQTILLVMHNVTAVLFPALGRLGDDPARQAQACVRATRLVAAVTVPMCFLQAAVAEPLVLLAYGERWVEVVPVLQVLSVGMAGTVIIGPATSLLQAQGRFGVYLLYYAIFCPIFLGGVWIAASLGAATSVAVAVTVTHLLLGSLCPYLALRPYGQTAASVAWLWVRPLLIGALGTLPAVGVVLLVDAGSNKVALAAELALASLAALLATAAAVRLLEPVAWGELTARLRPLLSRLSPRPAASA